MKNLIIIIICIISTESFGQYGTSQNYNVTVTQKQTLAEQIQKNQQIAAQRNAAIAEEMKDNYTKVKTDFLKNNSDKYENVIIKSVTGWSPGGNLVEIWNLLKDKKNVYNSLIFKRSGAYGYKKPYDYYKVPSNEIKNSPKTLDLSWNREAVTNNSRVSILTLENVNGDIIFEAEYKNKAYSEMLYPITSSNYSDNYTREEAIQKLKDSKELLELGVINQDEYNDLVKKLKPFLLK